MWWNSWKLSRDILTDDPSLNSRCDDDLMLAALPLVDGRLSGTLKCYHVAIHAAGRTTSLPSTTGRGNGATANCHYDGIASRAPLSSTFNLQIARPSKPWQMYGRIVWIVWWLFWFEMFFFEGWAYSIFDDALGCIGICCAIPCLLWL